MGHSPKLQAILEAARKRFREGGGIPHETFWKEVKAEHTRKTRNRRETGKETGKRNQDIQGMWRVAMPFRGPEWERDRRARLPKGLVGAAVREAGGWIPGRVARPSAPSRRGSHRERRVPHCAGGRPTRPRCAAPARTPTSRGVGAPARGPTTVAGAAAARRSGWTKASPRLGASSRRAPDCAPRSAGRFADARPPRWGRL